MDIAAIVHELDREIAKLQRVRAVIQSLEAPVGRKATRARARSKTPVAITAPPVVVGAEPKRLLLPPKKKREYKPRVRQLAEETTALAGNIPTQPVFVPRSILAKPVERQAQTVETSPDALETAIRQKLLGVPAAGFAQHALAAG